MPVEHVPINLLKAGGSGFFDAACVAALAKCGYSPDDFGTYDQVRSRIKNAQEQVSAMQKAGQPVPPELQRLADCQSGHIGMNTCRQRQRGNPCSNVVDGYYANQAACMPHQGGAFGDDGRPRLDTEHGRYTAAEMSAPGERGLTGGPSRPRDPVTGRIEPGGSQPGGAGETPTGRERYPQGDMNADERARVRDLLQRRAEEQQRATQASAQGAGQAGAAPGPAAGTGPASGAQGANVAASDAAADMSKTVDEAADCVMKFKEAMEEAMRRKCVADQTDNQNTANGGPNRTPAEGQAHRDGLRQNVADRQTELAARQKELRSEAGKLGHRRREFREACDARMQAAVEHERNPTPESAARLAAAREACRQPYRDLAAQQQASAAARQRVDQAERDVAGARRESSRAENANCLAQQASAIGDPSTGGRRDGRAPSSRASDHDESSGEAEDLG